MSAPIARSTRPRTSVLSFATNRSFCYQTAARFGVLSGTGCFLSGERQGGTGTSGLDRLRWLDGYNIVGVEYGIGSSKPGHPRDDGDRVIFERASKRYLQMSTEEFLEKWNNG